MACGNDEAFVHSSSNVKFKERNDAIFGGLSGLEEKYDKEVRKDDPFSEICAKKQKPRRPQKVPDHVLHPEKWTKYSLEEDGTSAVASGKTGDALNQEIAMNFINELRKRKSMEAEKCEDEKMDTSLEEQANNHTGLKRKRDRVAEDEEQALMEERRNRDVGKAVQSSTTAVVMKPYEFGQKQPKQSGLQPNVTKSEWSEKELNLSHLSEGVTDTEEAKSRDSGEVTETKPKFNAVRKKKKNLRRNDFSGDD